MNKTKKKLVLKKTNIRKLTKEELDRVAGANKVGAGPWTNPCSECGGGIAQ